MVNTIGVTDVVELPRAVAQQTLSVNDEAVALDHTDRSLLAFLVGYAVFDIARWGYKFIRQYKRKNQEVQTVEPRVADIISEPEGIVENNQGCYLTTSDTPRYEEVREARPVQLFSRRDIPLPPVPTFKGETWLYYSVLFIFLIDKSVYITWLSKLFST